MCRVRRKVAPGKVMLEPSPVLKEIKNSKKILVPNEIKAVMTSGQDPAQLSFQFVRRD